jgi:hypothetical protein
MPCPGLDPRTVHMRYVVDKVGLGRVFLRVLRLLPVTVIPPKLNIHRHLHVALTTQTKRRMPGKLPRSSALLEIGKHRIENYFHYFRQWGTADGGTVVKILCYKSEGCWFDSRWCHWNFSLT